LKAFLEFNSSSSNENYLAKYYALLEPLQEICGKNKHEWSFWPEGQYPFVVPKEQFVCKFCCAVKDSTG
jgi:hypothetical protein